MGNFFSNPVEQTLKKNQEYISEMNKIKVSFFFFLTKNFNKTFLKDGTMDSNALSDA